MSTGSSFLRRWMGGIALLTLGIGLPSSPIACSDEDKCKAVGESCLQVQCCAGLSIVTEYEYDDNGQQRVAACTCADPASNPPMNSVPSGGFNNGGVAGLSVGGAGQNGGVDSGGTNQGGAGQGRAGQGGAGQGGTNQGGGDVDAAAQPDAYECTGEPVTSALITDFSNVDDLTFSTAGGVGGLIYSFATTPAEISVVADAGRVDVTGSNGAGTIASVGLAFGACWDATAYDGIEFVLNGSLGSCTLQVSVHNNSTTPVDHEAMIGACTADCGPASTQPPNVGDTVALRWQDFFTISATPFNAADITGISWLIEGDNCDFEFALDDIRFIEAP